MNLNPFRDNAKSGKWVLREAEDKLRPLLARYVPEKIETYHLTLCTLVWSFGVVLSGYAAQYNIQWLWLSVLMIIFQYVTDLLDGTIGRMRNTGLVRWGYFMDHFLDYTFFTSLILSYAYIMPENTLVVLIFLSFIQIGFMINIFLSYGASQKLSISFGGVGPTELRILYILFTIYLIFFGTSIPVLLLPPFAIIIAGALVINVYLTQKMIWKLDMEEKAKLALQPETDTAESKKN